jgi:DNA helicase-2/ATP-dependent DNA helicase PcrA
MAQIARRRVFQVPETAEALLEGLNPEQAAIVQHVDGPLLAGAVAGAGKTTALVRRIAYLYRAHNVHPGRVLAVTFSKKAADEMTTRLARLLPGQVRTAGQVGTMHSLAFKFVRDARPELKDWQVDDRDRYRTCVKDALGFRGMNWREADLTTVSQFIGFCKARAAMPGTEQAREQAQAFYDSRPCGQRSPLLLCEAYERAEQLRRDRHMITFDDMLLLMWDLLSQDEGLRARWASKWDYVLQDESQDENPVQRAILEMLARDHRNYMIVGDPAQAIYGFRGSDPRGLLAFEQEWSARKILMERNYRSGSRILDAANGVLRGMAEGTHLGMQIKAERPEEGVVNVRAVENMDDEAELVAQEIRELEADGCRWRDMVVLYRTNAQSRAIEEQLLGNRVPYIVIGGTNFYDRKEIKDLLAYLRLAAGRGRFDDVRRSINAPFRFLGKAFVDRIEVLADSEDQRDGPVDWTGIVRRAARGSGLQERQRQSAESWCAMVDGLTSKIAKANAALEQDPSGQRFECKEARPGALIEGLLLDTDYVRWLTRDEGTESPENNRVSNIRELVRASERFNTVVGLLDYIDETIEAARRAKAGEDDGPIDRVTLMSIHRSKGLEWRAVFLLGANEGILPHSRCEDDNEERRLFYVAVTRAKDLLHITHVGSAAIGPRVVPVGPSRFLSEAGLGDLREPIASEEVSAAAPEEVH